MLVFRLIFKRLSKFFTPIFLICIFCFAHFQKNSEGDVSLASVAKDLGFDGRELTDMLERMPVDESLGGNEDMEGFLGGLFKNLLIDFQRHVSKFFEALLVHV